MVKELKWESKIWFFDDREDEVEAKAHSDPDYIKHSKAASNKLLIGPGGIDCPYDYNIWVGHTNFRLKKDELLNVCKSVDGVEHCTLMSDYRFQILIGKLFNGENIRSTIKNSLCSEPPKPKRYIAIIECGNKQKHVMGDTQEEAEEKIPKEAKVLKKSW